MTAKCKRCGKEFEPHPVPLATIKWSTCCETCECRNFMDGLGLPTHPALLDRHTKRPTITEEEYFKELKKG